MVDESDPATTFDQLARAADDVLGAFRARYPDPKTLAEKLEPYEDVLRGRRRDALVDYLTTRWPTPFSGPDRLSEYFLRRRHGRGVRPHVAHGLRHVQCATRTCTGC